MIRQKYVILVSIFAVVTDKPDIVGVCQKAQNGPNFNKTSKFTLASGA